ncbi:hypothetical protein [Kingella denitrificans]
MLKKVQAAFGTEPFRQKQPAHYGSRHYPFATPTKAACTSLSLNVQAAFYTADYLSSFTS